MIAYLPKLRLQLDGLLLRFDEVLLRGSEGFLQLKAILGELRDLSLGNPHIGDVLFNNILELHHSASRGVRIHGAVGNTLK